MHIQDAHIIDETLHDAGKSFSSWIAGGLDKLTKGQKAGLITSSLIFADVVKDPDLMRQIAQSQAGALNEYFDTIDYEKLVQSNNDALVQPLKARFKTALKSHMPTLLTGMVLGGIGTAIHLSKKDKK